MNSKAVPGLLILAALMHCKHPDFYLNVKDKKEPEGVDIAIKNFTAKGYKKHSQKWTLDAETSYISYGTSRIVMESIEMLYHENPRDSSLVTCDNAIMNRQTNDLTLEHNVEVKSSNGRELYTEILFWDSKKEELSTNAPVKIVYPDGEVIHGQGMRSNGSLSQIVIYKPVGVHNTKDK